MKHTILALMLSNLLYVHAYSAEKHDHNMDAQSMNTKIDKSQSSDLQVQMEKMKVLMERIRSEQNPEVRKKLMQEHMVAMEDGMQMMNDNMNKNSQTGSMDSEKRMDMMNHNMDMMHQMMQQMMQQMKGMSGGMGHM